MKAALTKTIKNVLPVPAKHFARQLKSKSDKLIARISYTSEQRQVEKLKNSDYSKLPLLAETEESIRRVKEAAGSVYGNSWNYYSNALRR